MLCLTTPPTTPLWQFANPNSHRLQAAAAILQGTPGSLPDHDYSWMETIVQLV